MWRHAKSETVSRRSSAGPPAKSAVERSVDDGEATDAASACSPQGAHATSEYPPRRRPSRLARAVLAAALAGAAVGGFALTERPAIADAGPEEAALRDLASPDGERRFAAIEACGAQRLTAAVPPLIDILNDMRADGQSRIAAAFALGEIGDARAVAPLIHSVQEDMRRRKGLAMAAIPALGMIGDARAVPILLTALRKREDRWLARSAAAAALGQIGDPAASLDLIAAGWMVDTRDAAVVALADMAEPRAVHLLLSALSDDEFGEETPAAAERGLIAIGQPTLTALAAMEQDSFLAISGADERARADAVLQAIGGPEAKRLRLALAAAPSTERVGKH